MFRLLPLALLLPLPVLADPALECSDASSQVEIADCLIDTEARVETALEIAVDVARSAAAELDDVTGRVVAVPALEQAQAAWEAYRQAQCDYVGATFGGGSGTGIGIRSCRIDLTRARIRALFAHAQ